MIDFSYFNGRKLNSMSHPPDAMTQIERCLKYALLFVVASCAVSLASTGARVRGAQNGPKDKFLDTQLPDFELHNQSVLDGLWKLARGPAPFGFGFEKVLKKRLADPEIQDTSFSLQMKNTTIRQVLDALCQQDPRFTWSLDGSTVNIFPKSTSDDPTYLLNRKLQSFELKNATDVQDGLLAIVRQLPPSLEQIAEAQVGGGDPYPPKPWTVTLVNLTVRQVVNRLATHGGPCGTWIFGGSKDFQAFGFFNTHPSPWLEKPEESHPKNP